VLEKLSFQYDYRLYKHYEEILLKALEEAADWKSKLYENPKNEAFIQECKIYHCEQTVNLIFSRNPDTELRHCEGVACGSVVASRFLAKQSRF